MFSSILSPHFSYADLKADEYGKTALHRAAEAGNPTELARICALNDANVNQQDKYGWTPLHFAVHSGNFEATLYLLSQKADVKAVNKIGWTALHYATGSNLAQPEVRIKMVQSLIEYGADCAHRDRQGFTALDRIQSLNSNEKIAMEPAIEAIEQALKKEAMMRPARPTECASTEHSAIRPTETFFHTCSWLLGNCFPQSSAQSVSKNR